MRNPLFDLEFLRELDLIKNKATYAKIILLTWNEEPIEEIQGKITSGSISIDGNSAVRRTCSLSMVTPNIDINNTCWVLKNKFKLEVGVENIINPQYPDIIWFNQGLFVFTGLNMSVQSNGYNISLNGKDKMCLLNGEIGGSINASTDFGKLEEYETLRTGEIIRNVVDIPIVDIIKNAVHIYGGEPLQNIVLNDIDEYGLELLEYRSDNKLFLPRNISTGQVENFIINKQHKYYLENGDYVFVDNDENYSFGKKQIIYYDRIDINNNAKATKLWPTSNTENNDEAYNIIKVEYGETAGYRTTELTYPGELVANVGESLVTILDKIKNMFGDFEYFYDIDGKFIFQKKKTYLNTSFNNLQSSETGIYATDAAYTSSVTYSFEDGVLLTAFANSPQITNIRNDFSVWGTRTSVSGEELPIHYRYAIHTKPKYYKPLRFLFEEIKLKQENYQPSKYYIFSKVLNKYILATDLEFDKSQTYYKESDEQDLTVYPFVSVEDDQDYYVLAPNVISDAEWKKREYYIEDQGKYILSKEYDKNKEYFIKLIKYDWRELIYQMALDYFKYKHKKSNFVQLIAIANPEHYPTGITGYETYYTDLQGFWRQIYHPGVLDEDGEDECYNLFSNQELYDGAKAVIHTERQNIVEQNIDYLIVDYIYKNYNNIQNNFITAIDYVKQIEEWIKISVETPAVVYKLMEMRWKELDGKDPLDYEVLIYEETIKNGNSAKAKALKLLQQFKIDMLTDTNDYFQQIVLEIDKNFIYNPQDNIDNFYANIFSSYNIQELLAKYREKLGKEDNTNYDEKMTEYLNNGGFVWDAEYTAYYILKEYRNKIKRAEETEGGYAAIIGEIILIFDGEISTQQTITKETPQIKILLNLRWKKLNYQDTTDYASLKAAFEPTNYQYKMYTILEEFRDEQVAIYNDVIKAIEYYIEQGMSEQSSAIQNFLAIRWAQMGNMDFNDYENMMKEYLKIIGNSKNDTYYKVLQILNNYKILHTPQLPEDEKEQIDYIYKITQLVKDGEEEDSEKIRTVLMQRWKEIDGKDSTNYLKLIETEYIRHGESDKYKALNIMLKFKNEQEKNFIDKEKIFIEELEENKFKINDSYLSFLYTSRQKKINNLKYKDEEYKSEFTYGNDFTNEDEFLSFVNNEKFIWLICKILKDEKINKDSFKEQLKKKMIEQTQGTLYFTQAIKNYIYENYDDNALDNTNKLFYIKDDQIFILDSELQELLDLRLNNDFSYLDNDMLMSIVVESFLNSKNKKEFKDNLNNRISEMDSILYIY